MSERLAQANTVVEPLLPLAAEVLTPAAESWLAASKKPTLLHLFPTVCNIVNEEGYVLSLITQEIDLTPCSILIASTTEAWSEKGLDRLLAGESPISTAPGSLSIGRLLLSAQDARVWDPRIKFTRCSQDILASAIDLIEHEMSKIAVHDSLYGLLAGERPSGNTAALYEGCKDFLQSLPLADASGVAESAKKIAGLGAGLTPSGDDFLIGAIYAMWLHDAAKMKPFIEKVVAHTAPLTTSLSADWLQAARRGEAALKWHLLIDNLVSGEEEELKQCTRLIARTGLTSGIDALTGFAASYKALG